MLIFLTFVKPRALLKCISLHFAPQSRSLASEILKDLRDFFHIKSISFFIMKMFFFSFLRSKKMKKKIEQTSEAECASYS